jgi:hypothetical protein
MQYPHLLRIAPVLLGLLAAPGCASLNLPVWKDKNPEASKENPVVNIVCVWEPAEGRNVNGLPARGFAGQIFFFTRLGATPVKVNGDVRVYVFDDLGSAEEQSKPIHQFDFLGDAWTVHLQDSTLGPSYNVFIPYTREGPWRANCQLRLRLTTETSQPVFSETVDVVLPGPARRKDSQKDGQTAEKSHPVHPIAEQVAAQMQPDHGKIQFGASLNHHTLESGPVPVRTPSAVVPAGGMAPGGRMETAQGVVSADGVESAQGVVAQHLNAAAAAGTQPAGCEPGAFRDSAGLAKPVPLQQVTNAGSVSGAGPMAGSGPGASDSQDSPSAGRRYRLNSESKHPHPLADALQ